MPNLTSNDAGRPPERTGHGVRYVLGVGLALAVCVMVLVLTFAR